MTTYNTGNPVPSGNAYDRFDNSQTFDEVVNGQLASYVNRKGQNVLSLRGMQLQFSASQQLMDAAFQEFLEGTGWSSLGAYAAGISIVSHTQTVDYEGQPYQLNPSVPVSIEAPYVTTGDWSTEGDNFKLVGDNSLRQDLAGVNGGAMVGGAISVVQDASKFATLTGKVSSLYQLRAFSADGTTGGGLFRFNPVASTPDGGTKFAGVTGTFERVLGIEPASPYWFGLPLVSTEVDNAAAIQKVLDLKWFEFPVGFKSHIGTTLNPKSNSVGQFNNAEFTLLSGRPSGTQACILGKNFTNAEAPTYTPERCINSVFHGGVFNGNKVGNPNADNPLGAAGGDGGMHGIQILDADNVRWYNVSAVDCGTDGIFAWQRQALPYPQLQTLINNVHFINPKITTSGRNGLSVCATQDLHFYDLTVTRSGEGATGKFPKSGIDIEPNDEYEKTYVYFHGVTTTQGNQAKGFVANNPGTEIIIKGDILVATGNLDPQAQVALYQFGGVAKTTFDFEDVRQASGFGFLANQASGMGAGSFNKVRVGSYVSTGGAFQAAGVTQLDIGTLDFRSNAPFCARFEGAYTGRIGKLTALNSQVGASAYPVQFLGQTPLTIDDMETSGSRGGVFDACKNLTIKNWRINGALLGSGIEMYGDSAGNKIAAQFYGSISADYLAKVASPAFGNDIELDWLACSRSFVQLSGTNNRLKVMAGAAVAGGLIATGGSNNLIYGSVFADSSAMVSGSSGFKLLSSTPFAVNSTS